MCNYRRFVRCKTLKIKEFELFKFIKNLINVFFEILFDSFNTYNQIKYIINLKNEQMFKFEFIYNMSQNEFATIREYFKSV